MVFPVPAVPQHGLSTAPAGAVLPCVLTLAQTIESG
jgi:hypothetical protein